MIVREAKQPDAPEVVAMGRHLVERSIYHVFEFNTERVEDKVDHLIADGDKACFVAEDSEGAVVGFLALEMRQPFYSHEIFVSDLAFFVNPDRRGTSAAKKLIEKGEDWARENGVRVFGVSLLNGADVDRSGRFMEHAGYNSLGGNYVKLLEEE